ncbi:MAG: LptF/LptG family permease [Hyphomicrobiales bacterium]|nr:LptF/LptG family permease [Bradyrhizobium sp.]
MLVRIVRRAVPVPFGRHTRYMISSYALHTFLVSCAILTIALSIDSTLFLSKVLATISTWNTSWTALYVAWYLLLRATDFLAELLPLACFLGAFWTEVAHTRSRERLVIWLSGRTPWQCMLPALLFGLIVAGAQLALNLYFRPNAVMAMARDHLGSYGERFDPRPLPYPQWFASGHNIVQAFVEPGDPATLRDVKIYRMDETLSLHEFLRAKSARPAGRDEWTLIDGYRWTSSQATEQLSSGWSPGSPGPDDQIPFSSENITLNLSPVWLNNNRIGARYLTGDVFTALKKEDFSPAFEFRTWQQARWSLALFCTAMVLLATRLSLATIAKRITFVPLIAIAIAGYGANSLMKVSILLGEHGYVPAPAAAWLAPVLILSACGAVGLARRAD